MLALLGRAAAAATSPADGGSVAGPGQLYDAVLDSLYARSEWPQLGATLAADAAGNSAPAVAQSNHYNTGGSSNADDAAMAIDCLDHPVSRDLASYAALADSLQASAPVFGPLLAWGEAGCAVWPAAPTRKVGPVAAPGSPPILLVGTTNDPATPYAWAVNVSKELAHGVLLTFDGDDHVAYFYSACVRADVQTYLVGGRRRRRGRPVRRDPGGLADLGHVVEGGSGSGQVLVKRYVPLPTANSATPSAADTTVTPGADPAATPPSRTCEGPLAGSRTRARAFGGTVSVSAMPWSRRCQDTCTGPATEGTEPWARSNPLVGGTTTARTVPSGSGSSKATPRRVSCIATRADEPHPCDMESPMRSLGFQTSQVNVPPAATMWAQPGTDASVSVWTIASGIPAAASPRRSSSPWLGPTSMPRPAT